MKKLLTLLVALTLIASCRPRHSHTRATDRAPLKERSSLGPSLKDNNNSYSSNSYNKSHDVQKRKQSKVSVKTGPRPAWLDGYDSNYPKNRYLIAVGSARHNDDRKTRSAAEDNLRAEMSHIFDTAVTASSKSIKKANAVRINNKLKGNRIELESQDVIRTETKSRYFGMIMSDYWKDSDGTLYVLGTIDKTTVRPLLAEKMDDLDEIINGLVEVAKNSDDPVLRAKELYKALDKAIIREFYAKQMMIMGGGIIKTPYTVDILADMIEQNFESMKVAVVVEGEGGKEIKNVILNVGTSMGLQIDAKYKNEIQEPSFESFNEDLDAKVDNYGKDADILIKGSVNYKTLDRGDKYKWVVVDVNITLINQKVNKVYKAFRVTKRTGSFSYQDSKRKASLNIAKKLRKQLKTKLKKAISGL